MTYNFHTPKYLFFQLAVFTGVAVILFRNRLTFRFNLLDGIIIVRLLWMVPLKFLFDRYANLFENADILASLALFYFLVQIMVSDRTETEIAGFLKQVFVVLAIVCSMEAIYGLMQYCGLDLFHPGGYSSYESKVVGTFGSANSMGCFLAVLTPILFYLFGIQKTKTLKILCGLGIVPILFGIVLTLSRGAWTALIGGLIFLVYPSSAKFVKKRVSGRSAKIGIVIAVILAILLFIVGIFFLNPDSALGRIFIWKVSLPMIADYPVLGIGYGNYGYQYLNYQMRFFDDPVNAIPNHRDKACAIKDAHSEFVNVTAETGLIGLLLFVLLIFLYFRYLHARQIRADKTDMNIQIRVLTASFLIIVIHSTVDSVLHTLPVSILFYFCLSMMSMLSGKDEKKPLNWTIIRPGKILKTMGIMLLFINLFILAKIGTGFVHWKKGQNAVYRYEWQSGIREYEKALKILPENDELKFHLGAAYAYIGQTRLAIALLEESLTGFNDKNIYIALSKAYLDSGDYTKSEECLKTVTYMFPQVLSPHLLLAQLYYRAGFISKAVSELQFIIEAEPKIMSEEVITVKQDAQRMLSRSFGMAR